MSKININEKSKSIRKYAGRTIALEKQNYKTSKIAWGTSVTIMDIPFFSMVFVLKGVFYFAFLGLLLIYST
jgi:hypothetical protein